MTPTTLAPLPSPLPWPPVPLPLPPQRRAIREPSYRWCFLLGLGGMTFVRLIGYMAFTEVYFFITAPWQFGRHFRLITHGVGGTVMALWIGWVLVALASDLWNDVQFELMARGVSRALFTGLAILSVFVICVPSWKRFDYVVLGIPFSMIISLFAFKPGQQDIYETGLEESFRFQTSLNYVLTAAIVAATTFFYGSRPWVVIVSLFVAGPLYIAMGSRAMGAIFIAAGLTTLFFRLLGDAKRPKIRKVPWWRFVLFGACGLGLILGGARTYDYLASEELLDEKQVAKYQRESQAEGGVFFGSRGIYILTGLLAWWDRPILGHGSWPEDNDNYYPRAAEILNVPAADYQHADVKGMAVRKMLPIHSVLVSALAEHGPIAFLFFAYLAYLNIRAVRLVPSILPQYTATFAIFLWMNAWNLLASPQGHRVPTALAFAFPVLVCHYSASLGAHKTPVINR